MIIFTLLLRSLLLGVSFIGSIISVVLCAEMCDLSFARRFYFTAEFGVDPASAILFGETLKTLSAMRIMSYEEFLDDKGRKDSVLIAGLSANVDEFNNYIGYVFELGCTKSTIVLALVTMGRHDLVHVIDGSIRTDLGGKESKYAKLLGVRCGIRKNGLRVSSGADQLDGDSKQESIVHRCAASFVYDFDSAIEYLVERVSTNLYKSNKELFMTLLMRGQERMERNPVLESVMRVVQCRNVFDLMKRNPSLVSVVWFALIYQDNRNVALIAFQPTEDGSEIREACFSIIRTFSIEQILGVYDFQMLMRVIYHNRMVETFCNDSRIDSSILNSFEGGPYSMLMNYIIFLNAPTYHGHTTVSQLNRDRLRTDFLHLIADHPEMFSVFFNKMMIPKCIHEYAEQYKASIRDVRAAPDVPVINTTEGGNPVQAAQIDRSVVCTVTSTSSDGSVPEISIDPM